MLPVEQPFKTYTGLDGKPLNNGYVYFGQPNQDPANVSQRVTVYWDAAGTLPADQPLRTVNGYIVNDSGSPANVFFDGAYSELVRDSKMRQVFYARTSDEFSVNSIFSAFIDSLDGPPGADKMGFAFDFNYVVNTIGWGMQTAGNSFNLWRLIPPAEWPKIADGTSTFDATAVITAAWATYKDVWAPPGRYNINPEVGARFVAGATLRGAGYRQTQFYGIPGGGSLGELASYTKGSLFARTFAPGEANERIDGVHLSDFAVIMNHPTAAVTISGIQIGLDMRNVGRFTIDRVWVGNLTPQGGLLTKADPGAYAAQGYAIVCGNVDTGNVAYCGGEVSRITNCCVYGAYKLIVIDDLTLSPLSGNHAVNVIGCDLQGGHHLLVQEQQYTAGCLWDGNTIQDIRRRPGDASPTYVLRLAGYDNEIRPGYIEAGIADYLLRFDSASVNNRVKLTHYSATTIGIAAFSDAGRRNRVECAADSGVLPGGVDSKGRLIVRYDRSYEEMSVVTHWDGSAMVIDGGFALTPSRPTAAGDYVFTFGLPTVDPNCYTVDVSYDTNSSGHGGTHAVISHNTANIRIQFYAQNGAVSTPIDPRWVFVRIKQI